MRRGESGFTYVWTLAAVAVLGVGLAALGTAWSADVQREREAELLRFGALYARAIASYHRASPGSVKRYPPSLDALLLDTRFVGTQRHLRRLYADPLDPKRPWGLVRGADGGIRGVYSQSEDKPLRQVPPAARYADVKFIAEEER